MDADDPLRSHEDAWSVFRSLTKDFTIAARSETVVSLGQTFIRAACACINNYSELRSTHGV
jgi:hypothetical protein